MRFGGRRDFGGGRRFGGSRFDREDRGFDEPKPIKAGEEYDVEIKETGSKGDGIARISNFVVFVNGAKIGEKLRVKITDVRNRFAIAEKVGTATQAEVPEEKKTEMSEESDEGEEEGSEESSEEKTEEE